MIIFIATFRFYFFVLCFMRFEAENPIKYGSIVSRNFISFFREKLINIVRWANVVISFPQYRYIKFLPDYVLIALTHSPKKSRFHVLLPLSHSPYTFLNYTAFIDKDALLRTHTVVRIEGERKRVMNLARRWWRRWRAKREVCAKKRVTLSC